MIAFGSSITSRDLYGLCAERGIRLAAEPDTAVLARPAVGSIFAGYNQILEEAAALEGLEGLVLLHQDTEIVDPHFCSKLRRVLEDPEVGVVGCVGAIGVRSIAWWEGSITWASFIHRYPEFGGGDFPSMTWDELPPYGQLGEVDTVDGFVLGLSPWVVRNVRFDESLGQALHGYDFDFCLQVRAAGRKIVTADFKVIHHHSLELSSDLGPWAQAHVSIAEKWDGKMPDVGVGPGDWRERARNAEAEAATLRAQAIATELKIDAQAAHYDEQVSIMTDSLGWKLTAPVRHFYAVGRARRRRSALPRPTGPDASNTVLGRRLRRRASTDSDS
jgi:Glycosyltransferase like family